MRKKLHVQLLRKGVGRKVVHGAVVLGEQGEYESGVVQIVVVGKAPNEKRKVEAPKKKNNVEFHWNDKKRSYREFYFTANPGVKVHLLIYWTDRVHCQF